MFGRLTVIEQVEDHISVSGRHHPNWKCQCACGNIINIIGSHLKNGHTSSCGCKRSEIVSEYMSQKMKKYNTYDLSGISDIFSKQLPFHNVMLFMFIPPL